MIIIQDYVLPLGDLLNIRDATFHSGYGTWKPAIADLGHKETDGMNWQGYHAPLHVAIYNIMKEPIFPNHSFFKISTKNDNPSLIHSDRNDGSYTAILYMSEHEYKSGTGFYRHLETNSTTMPTVQSMVEDNTMEKWNEDMKDESKWEQTDFVQGLLGRMIIFSAPMFHSRIPRLGSGDTYEEGRIVWVCHFFTASDFTGGPT